MFYIVGIFSLWGGLRTIMISSLVTYYLSKYFQSPLMPWANFFFLMGHLLVNHVQAQVFADSYDPNEIDITGTQMVLVMKLSAFGWNVYDGRLPEASLSDFQKDRAIREHPSLLDYFSYVFYFPSILTGPSYDFREYQRWLDLSMFEVISDDTSKRRKKRKIPRSGRVSALKCAEGIAWIVLWVLITPYVHVEQLFSPKFLEYSFARRMVYLWILGFTYRLKYYGAWSISEGACILSGLGFNGKDKNGKYKWNRVQNVDPITFETGQNTHVLLEAWNMNTNKWLKNYVYLRVTPKGRKPGFTSTFITFATSALWHGTQPGYYMTFITGAFYQSLGKAFRRKVRPIFMESDGVTPGKHKKFYDFLTYFVTQLGFGYACQPFVILKFGDSMRAWKTVYFSGHVFIFLSILLFKGPFQKQFLQFLQSYYPVPLSERDKIKLDSAKLRAIKKEIEELSSTPSLGVPSADWDTLDDDLKDAVDEFEEIKKDLSIQIEQVKRRASISLQRPSLKPDDGVSSDKSK